MKKEKNLGRTKKLLALGLVIASVCMTAACTINGKKVNSTDSLAGTNSPNPSAAESGAGTESGIGSSTADGTDSTSSGTDTSGTDNTGSTDSSGTSGAGRSIRNGRYGTYSGGAIR